MGHRSTPTSSSKTGKLLEACRAVPQNPGSVSGPLPCTLGTRGVSLSLWGHLVPPPVPCLGVSPRLWLLNT